MLYEVITGDLHQAYSHARVVFVGGSLVPLGGQNFMEPAALGIPTIIGPHWQDFAWVGDVITSYSIHYTKLYEGFLVNFFFCTLQALADDLFGIGTPAPQALFKHR